MSIIYPKTQNVMEVINVKDYGATGDGVTDDTAAIQAAVNAIQDATDGGGEIFFPPGEYRVESSVTVTGSNVTFSGVHNKGTDGGVAYHPFSAPAIVAADKTVTPFVIDAPDLYTGNVAFRKLLIRCESGASDSTNYGVKFASGAYRNKITFDSVQIFGFKCGIYSDATLGICTIHNCDIQGNRQWGIYLSGLNSGSITSSSVRQNGIYDSTNSTTFGDAGVYGGIYIHHGSGIVIENVDVEGQDIGIMIGDESIVSSGVVVRGCYEEANDNAFCILQFVTGFEVLCNHANESGGEVPQASSIVLNCCHQGKVHYTSRGCTTGGSGNYKGYYNRRASIYVKECVDLDVPWQDVIPIATLDSAGEQYTWIASTVSNIKGPTVRPKNYLLTAGQSPTSATWADTTDVAPPCGGTTGVKKLTATGSAGWMYMGQNSTWNSNTLLRHGDWACAHAWIWWPFQRNEVQTIHVSDATGGTYTLTYSGQTTTDLAFDATPAEIEAALEALSNIDAVTVTGAAVSDGGHYAVEFKGTLDATDVALMTATSSLTGGGSESVTIAEEVKGETQDSMPKIDTYEKRNDIATTVQASYPSMWIPYNEWVLVRFVRRLLASDYVAGTEYILWGRIRIADSGDYCYVYGNTSGIYGTFPENPLNAIVDANKTLYPGIPNDNMDTATDEDETPSVHGLSILKTENTGTTTITTLDEGTIGQRVAIIIGDNNTTIVHGSGIILANGSGWDASTGDVFDFIYDGTNWLEIKTSS